MAVYQWNEEDLTAVIRRLKSEKDSLEIYVDNDSIILRKYQPACVFCDNARDVIVYKGKNVCRECIKALEENL